LTAKLRYFLGVYDKKGDQMAVADCNFEQVEFQGVGHRKVEAAFDGGNVTSDAGGLLLREVVRGSRIIDRLADCFSDFRKQDLVDHSVRDLVAQRVIGLCLGYEDLNDHEHLRNDPVFCTLVDRIGRDGAKKLAGKSTLNRLELTPGVVHDDERYKKIVYSGVMIKRLFTDIFLEAHSRAPKEIWLDLDATDNPIHGDQEGKHFHAYYDEYCYLPLYIFAGDFLLSSRLRSSGCDPIDGVTKELARIVAQIRKRWPKVRIILRGDSGFCREEVMVWCEKRGIDFVLGLARNSILEGMIASDMDESKRCFQRTRKAAKRYRNLRYQTQRTWSRSRRVVAKAEYLSKGENPRFVVTSIRRFEADAKSLYEKMYCARGNMENRLKEQQMGLFSDRTSTHRMRSNQLRLYFSSIAYVLMNELRRIGLQKTDFASAQCWTIRERLFKIGAVVTVTFRRIRLSMSSGYPWREIFTNCLKALQAHYVYAT
jgi:hypothetical protein